MAFANKIAELCAEHGIEWKMNDQWIHFSKGSLHATSHVFDDYVDTVKILKQTQIIPAEAI